MRDEAELIRAAVRGDRRSFEELVILKRERVVRTAFQITGNLEDARDVSQGVFVTLWRSLHRYDPDRPFDTWLYRVTVNAAIDLVRSRGPRPEAGATSLDPATSAPTPDPDRRIRARELRDAFRALAAELPPQQRAAFVLREAEGRSTAEIGEILEVSESTVRNHLLLARRALRKGLEARYPELLPAPRREGDS
jgi:RNA polymerase sigma-70 factor (ECF subfamily)